MTDGIELDNEDKPKEKADVVGVLMAAASIITFGCLVAAMTVQYLEFSYMRGTPGNGEDPYSAEQLIPPAS